MFIIVEGPDCSGKSTIVHRLRVALTRRDRGTRSTTVLHKGPPTRHPLHEYELDLLHLRGEPAHPENVVADRWHLGELVYPEVKRRPSKLDDASFAHVELFLRSLGAVVVYCARDLESTVDCVRTRGDDYVSESDVRGLLAGYERALRRTTLPYLLAPYGDVTDELIEAIIGVADRAERAAAKLRRFTTYVGPPRPDLLLLGDVRQASPQLGKRVNANRVPAFVPFTATSGHYLLSLFGRPELRGLGVANACDVDDPRALVEALGHPAVVTLGRNAHAAYPDAPTVVHPQYQRRFRHRATAEYRADILNALVHRAPVDDLPPVRVRHDDHAHVVRPEETVSCGGD